MDEELNAVMMKVSMDLLFAALDLRFRNEILGDASDASMVGTCDEKGKVES